jgi:predicted amidohydrolase YtcJ/alkylation response protein AidB-like acyl-CoA dehydrogenase
MTALALDDDQRALLDLVRDYAAKEVAPRAAEDEAAGRFPRDLFDGLARLDLTGLPFAPEVGGLGQPYGVYLRVIEELSRSFLTVGLGLSVHTLATWAVDTYAPDDLRAEVVPRMTAGRWLGAYSLSEPGSGSDAAALTTRAQRDGDSYTVSGTKAWVTHAGHADAYVLLCRTGEHKTRGISALLVHADIDGLSFPAPEHKMGMRSSPTGQLVFDHARVPARNLLGEEGTGFRIAMSALDGGRLGIAACSVGLAQSALDRRGAPDARRGARALHAGAGHGRVHRRVGQPQPGTRRLGRGVGDRRRDPGPGPRPRAAHDQQPHGAHGAAQGHRAGAAGHPGHGLLGLQPGGAHGHRVGGRLGASRLEAQDRAGGEPRPGPAAVRAGPLAPRDRGGVDPRARRQPLERVRGLAGHRLRPARALVIEGERIAWVGEDPGAAPPADRVIDLGGAWITPSFVDAHVHATATGLGLTGIDLRGAGSIAECVERIRAHAVTQPDGTLIGHGWDSFGWPEDRPLHAADIARAAPGRRALLSRVDGHSSTVDPATLAALPLTQLAGVDRGEDGEPTGWLVEAASEAALRHVLDALPPPQVQRARLAACEHAAGLGIGSIHEMGHPGLSSLDDAQVWAEGDWPVEVHVWWAELDVDRAQARGLRPGGDLFLDGSIGSCTAAVTAGYPDGGQGILFHPDEEVAAFFTAASRAGLGAGVHAIGDAAIEQAVRGLEAAAAVLGAETVSACRHRIEHVELPRRDQVARMAALRVVASMQPAFDATWGGPDGLYAARFGEPAALDSNPISWFAEAGVPLTFGSDSTVTPMDPWAGVIAAERHRGGKSVPREAALRAHTLGGRYVAGQADVGPLRAGLRADLAVWDADPMAADDPREGTCVRTLVRGRTAHADGEKMATDSGSAEAR